MTCSSRSHPMCQVAWLHKNLPSSTVARSSHHPLPNTNRCDPAHPIPAELCGAEYTIRQPASPKLTGSCHHASAGGIEPVTYPSCLKESCIWCHRHPKLAHPIPDRSILHLCFQVEVVTPTVRNATSPYLFVTIRIRMLLQLPEKMVRYQSKRAGPLMSLVKRLATFQPPLGPPT